MRLLSLALFPFLFLSVHVAAESLKVVTLNVLATPWKAELRIPALFAELEAAQADIIALQEVAPWITDKLQEEPWLENYHYPQNQAGEIQIAHEFLILTKAKPLSRQTLPLPSKQGRIAFLTTIPFADSTLTITTVHLDSLLEDGPIRAQQLDTLFEKIRDFENTIVLGDFNFGDAEEPDTSSLPANYIDPWLILNPNDSGFTWDRERNKRARRDSFIGETSRRLDRILIKSAELEAKAISLFADEPVSTSSKNLFPSDHFGLVCTFVHQMKKADFPAKSATDSGSE